MNAGLLIIGLIAVLMTIVALAAMYVPAVNDQSGAIVATVLSSLATIITGVFIFMKMTASLNTVQSQGARVENKVDTAAETAQVAADKAATVEDKIDRVHHDVLNGPMRANIRKAISEDRHEKLTRMTRDSIARQLRQRGIDVPMPAAPDEVESVVRQIIEEEEQRIIHEQRGVDRPRVP